MADALISLLIETLGSMAFEKIKDELGLLTGVDEEIEKLKNTFLNIQAVLDDAEKRQLNDPAVAIWVDKLKDVSFDIDDVLDEWMTPTALKSKLEEEGASASPKRKVWLSLLSLCACSGGDAIVLTRHRIAQEIRELNESLDKMAKDKDRFKLERAEHVDGAPGASSRVRKITSSLINEKEVCGRDVEREVLVQKLLPATGKSGCEDRGFGILSVVGIGGLGKTTLAQLAYNDERVKNRFDSRVWVCVSDPFDEIRIARAILKSLKPDTQDSDDLNHLVQRIDELVRGKVILLVLDDVWNESYDKWEELEKSLGGCAAGSMILVTTRKEKVSVTMRVARRDMITLETLSDEHCWLIFSQKAFFDRTEEECRRFEEIGRKIAKKSKGLPLLAKTLGGFMSYKKTINQWSTVLDSELWELKADMEIFAPFFLSYYDLMPVEKRCLLYCSIFPKDYVIQKDMLIHMWMSQGFLGCNVNLEGEGEACFESLAMRSFFQDFEKDTYDGHIATFKMHDIVCDFIKLLTKNEYIVLEDRNRVDNDENSSAEKFRHLALNLHEDRDVEEVSKYNDKKKKLRTLFFTVSCRYIDNGDDLFRKQTRFRTLILAGRISLPTTIGQLIHLRYLDVSHCECKELPETICDLYNLQTLDLSHIVSCENLPNNINKLTNLRYLNLSSTKFKTLPDSICDLPKLRTLILKWSSLSRMPEGIGKLVMLRNLDFSNCWDLEGVPKSMVSLTNLHKLNMDLSLAKDTESYLNLEDLKSLRHVLNSQSYFALYGFTNVRSASECRDIGIDRMELLAYLIIDFLDDKEPEEERMEDREREIFEALQLPPSLKTLAIKDYMGSTISPKWMMSNLVNLTAVELIRWHCTVLPPFGKLPFLESLVIRNFENLKMVGPEFLGIVYDDEAHEDGDIEEKPCSTFFPKLKTLSFCAMPAWESWVGTTTTNTVIMPCLVRLYLYTCPSLKAVPDSFPLANKLVINNSYYLERKYW